MADDRLDPAYGDLNPVEEEEIGEFYDIDTTTPTQTLRKIAKDRYKKNALNSPSPYKGIVLRKEPPGDHEAGSWVRSTFGNIKPPKLLGLKVRIPEIHAALPVPANYGSAAGPSQKIIDMYPTFIAVSEDVGSKPVAPGDIVSVDFGNRDNMTDPKYLGPIFNQPLPGAVGKESSKKEPTSNKLATNPPVGDKVGSGTKDEASQIPTAVASKVDENKQAKTLGSETSVSKPKAKLVSVEMDRARFGFAKGKGYPRIRMREDVAGNLAEVKRVLNELGAVLVSVGSLRHLDAPVTPGRAATSFHYTALAFDLWTHCGAYPDGNPSTDEYVVEFDRTSPPGPTGPLFRVWARSTQTKGSITTKKGTFNVEYKKLRAIDVRKSFRQKTAPKEMDVEGYFVDLTAIMLAHNLDRIGGKSSFYARSDSGTAEWWHFESHSGLVSGETSYGEALGLISDPSSAPPWKYRDLVWNGKFFTRKT